jgi:Mg2+ and Co2+ transporter CorA
MEETREKIELFRNYYLVCFRSFDQDPYSPTHLEPLNMYIVVFREGVLSVSHIRVLFASTFGCLPFFLVFLSCQSHTGSSPTP